MFSEFLSAAQQEPATQSGGGFGGAKEGGDCSLKNFHWSPLVAGVSRLPSKPHPALGREGWRPHLELIAADATQHREGGSGLDGGGGGAGRGGGGGAVEAALVQ